MTPPDFIAALAGPARALAARTRIPASFTVAQGALESNFGRSQLALSGCNLFGVKADSSWAGAVLLMPTREFQNGAWVTIEARWRKYADWTACLDDHADFLLHPRYRAALATTNSVDYARAIAAAGYATDPQYADKLIDLMRQFDLFTLDSVQNAPVPVPTVTINTTATPEQTAPIPAPAPVPHQAVIPEASTMSNPVLRMVAIGGLLILWGALKWLHADDPTLVTTIQALITTLTAAHLVVMNPTNDAPTPTPGGKS